MPTTYRQSLVVSQRTDRALTYGGRQYRTRTIVDGNVLTSVGLVEVGPSFGTGPAVVQVVTGFRPKVLFISAVLNRPFPGGVGESPSYSYGVTIDDNGTLVRYSQSYGRTVFSTYQTGDENLRVASGPVSYRIYRLTQSGVCRLTAVTGNVLSVNDAGFTIEVDNDYPYQITFLAIGGTVTVAHGRVTCLVNKTSSTSVNLPFIPDSLFLFDLPFWNDEVVYYQTSNSSTPTYNYSFSGLKKLFYSKYANQQEMLYTFHTQYGQSNQISTLTEFYLRPPNLKANAIVTFSVSNQKLTIGNWNRNEGVSLDFVYVAISGLSIKFRREGIGAATGQSYDLTVTLDFEVGNLMVFPANDGEEFIAFDPHEQSRDWYVVWLSSGEIRKDYFLVWGVIQVRKRLEGFGRHVYLNISNPTGPGRSGHIFFVQFLSTPPGTVSRQLTLFVSSWYRQYLDRARNWGRILSTASNWVARLFYESIRRTETVLELIAQSGHLSELFQAWKKLLYVRGFSIAEILDTTWGRNLRPIRLLTPSDIDVCPGDELVLRLKVRHGNHDRNMARMNDIVRMALLDYWTKTPVYWFGLGSGIEYDAEGQAVITIPWTVLNEAFGRDRICRYRVELWPDERLGVGGWIVHVGIIREAR